MDSGEISLDHLLLHFHETYEESFRLDKQGPGLGPLRRKEDHDSKSPLITRAMALSFYFPSSY